MSGLARSALVIDEMMASWRSNILSSRPAAAIWSFILPMPGIMPMMPPMPPIFCICRSWSARSFRSNLPVCIFLAIAAAFSASMFSAAFSTSETMSPMPRMRSAMRLGMELLQRVHLLADADQLDRLAGDGAHRKRRAAAAVAVHAGQHEAGDADALVEVAREVDGVLAGQRIGDQQDFVRIGRPLDLGHLGHQRLVDMGAAGGVEDDDVVAAELGRLHGARWRSRPATGRR